MELKRKNYANTIVCCNHIRHFSDRRLHIYTTPGCHPNAHTRTFSCPAYPSANIPNGLPDTHPHPMPHPSSRRGVDQVPVSALLVYENALPHPHLHAQTHARRQAWRAAGPDLGGIGAGMAELCPQRAGHVFL
jgi:hypothetical protein